MAQKFSERSLQVCRDFLQTAVIIDDRFSIQPRTMPEPHAVVPGRKHKPQIIRIKKMADLNSGSLNVNRLISSFAAHGIICGAINFKDYNSDSTAFIKTAKRADIAIIDWEMEEEKTGEYALRLISELLHDDLLLPQRFRLISIYTGTEDLSSISEAIQNHLMENHDVQLNVQDQGLLLRYHSITITIFAKDKHGIPDHFIKSVVDENELPDRLISCFSQSVNGLLPNTALAALTALRNNSHKLIGQFSRRLDAAYLSHKIMSNPPDDAENQLVQLFVSHISGLLEELDVADQANFSSTELWLKEQCSSGVQFRRRIHSRKSNEHAKEQLLKLIKGGLSKASINKGNKSFYKQVSDLKHEKTKVALSEFTKIFTCEPNNAEILDRDFSFLLSCKNFFYETSIPKLEPGAILKLVQDDSAEKYFICIQPACDCIRVPRKGRNFLFLPLVSSSAKFDMSIPRKSLAPLNLSVDDKAYSICTLHFSPPKALAPIHAGRSGDQWVFVDSESTNSYEWIATLKRELVLRLAHNYGKNVSRVGITESEWQRRWAK